MFLDLLEIVAEKLQPEKWMFKYHMLIIKYMGKRERKKSTSFLTGQGRASL